MIKNVNCGKQFLMYAYHHVVQPKYIQDSLAINHSSIMLARNFYVNSKNAYFRESDCDWCGKYNQKEIHQKIVSGFYVLLGSLYFINILRL